MLCPFFFLVAAGETALPCTHDEELSKRIPPSLTCEYTLLSSLWRRHGMGASGRACRAGLEGDFHFNVTQFESLIR